VFTLTNTGTATLTGISQASLGGTNSSSFTIVRLLSTCGPAGNGQIFPNTTLAAGASCAVTVRFQPPTNQSLGLKNATVSVTDAVGTQTSTLTGTAQ
jgi:trimeric autotransporter adhesin